MNDSQRRARQELTRLGGRYISCDASGIRRPEKRPTPPAPSRPQQSQRRGGPAYFGRVVMLDRCVR